MNLPEFRNSYFQNTSSLKEAFLYKMFLFVNHGCCMDCSDQQVNKISVLSQKNAHPLACLMWFGRALLS